MPKTGTGRSPETAWLFLRVDSATRGAMLVAIDSNQATWSLYDPPYGALDTSRFSIDGFRLLALDSPEPGRIYSNIYYHDETGGLLGDELLVIGTSANPVVLWTIAEGQPNGPYMTAVSMSKNDTVEFSAKLNTETIRHKLYMTSKGAFLWRKFESVDSFESPIFLPRAGTISTPLRINREKYSAQSP